MGVNSNDKLENYKISEIDLIESIQDGNEYILSNLDGVIHGKYSKIDNLKKYLDEKVAYGHICKREEQGEIIYCSNPEKYTILLTKKIINNIMFGNKLFNPNDENKSA